MPCTARLLRVGLGIFLTAVTSAQFASAQIVRGRVLDADSNGVPSVSIILVGPEGTVRETAVSDSAGAFLLASQRAGVFILHASHVGYLNIEQPIDLKRGEEVTVRLNLRQAAVALEPLVVSSRRRVPLDYVGYHQRVRMGIGSYIQRDAIARRRPIRTTDLFQVMSRVRVIQPGLAGPPRIVMRTAGGADCLPNVFVDGVMSSSASDLNSLMPTEIEGIEIYSTSAMTPIQFQRNTNCGAVVVWLRRDEGGRAFSFKRLFAALGIFAGVYLVSR